jgi:hypothetical protein
MVPVVTTVGPVKEVVPVPVTVPVVATIPVPVVVPMPVVVPVLVPVVVPVPVAAVVPTAVLVEVIVVVELKPMPEPLLDAIVFCSGRNGVGAPVRSSTSVRSGSPEEGTVEPSMVLPAVLSAVGNVEITLAMPDRMLAVRSSSAATRA